MNLNRRRDGHVHSPFCPHGSNDTLEMYIETAIMKGLKEITFTEHMPLPLEDPSPRKNSALKIENLEEYFIEIGKVKEKYKDKVKINIGLEVDYIEGKEKETKTILDKYGMFLDDAILSVHILKYNNEYFQIGNGSECIGPLVKKLGGMNKVYNLYYETLLKSIKCDLGKYKPKRLGHTTLVRKYRADFPNEEYNIELLKQVVRAIKQNGYEIDLNTAGLRKSKCRETFPTGIFMKLLLDEKIPMVLGSDAHSSKEIGSVFNDIDISIILNSRAV